MIPVRSTPTEASRSDSARRKRDKTSTSAVTPRTLFTFKCIAVPATVVANKLRCVTSRCNKVAYSLMILPQVHLRKPCYDFCPVQATAIKAVSVSKKPVKASSRQSPFFSKWLSSGAATGGVYKGQGRNQHELMTRTY